MPVEIKHEPKRVFLTFDDGPNDPITTQILDILKEFGVKATFFLCGKCVELFPQIAIRIKEEGHVIGNHTYSHKRRNFLLLRLFSKEVEKAAKIIKGTTGVETLLFRPPWGFMRTRLRRYLGENGYQIILWDIDTKDWKRISAENIINNILSKIRPGSIVLLHDGDQTKLKANRSQTIFALPMIIRNLINQGYTFEKIALDDYEKH